MKTTTKLWKAALYMRLSKDDDGVGESSSIGTQRKMLRCFSDENHFIVHDEYIDDGYSGTNFTRPAFHRMIEDVESGYVNLVITKDLSRLGRDYITAGQYTEMYFPEHGVRFIAINDGYDSVSPYNDIAPFKHVINEMYARDTSKKIRSAFVAKMKEGAYIGNFAPYGYKKDPCNKNHLLIDYEAALIVKEMFRMAENGYRPSEIAESFNTKGITTPALYRCEKHPNLDPNKYTQRREWTSAMICKMLRNCVYIGNTAQGKTTKVSFKSSITLSNAAEDWYVVENTHESLISKEMFNLVQNRSVSRKNPPKTEFKNIFSGIAKCMDCNRNMSTAGTRKKGSVANLVCGGYKLYGSNECTNHFIGYEEIYTTILRELRKQIALTVQEKQEILDALKKNEQMEGQCDSEKNKTLKNLNRRTAELDGIIKRLYEDNVCGNLSNERFSRMLESYEKEQNNINSQIAMFSSSELCIERTAYENFFELIDGITDMEELTPCVLKKFIDHIEIGQGSYAHDGDGGRKKKHQVIKIFYKFIGNVT